MAHAHSLHIYVNIYVTLLYTAKTHRCPAQRHALAVLRGVRRPCRIVQNPSGAGVLARPQAPECRSGLAATLQAVLLEPRLCAFLHPHRLIWGLLGPSSSLWFLDSVSRPALLALLHPAPDRFRLRCGARLHGRAGRVNTGNAPLDTNRCLFRDFLHLLFSLSRLILTRLILAAIIIRILVHHKPVRNPADEEPPEQINRLQRSEEGEGDVLRDPALVLLCFPVELPWADGAEGGEDGVEDFEVDEVAQVAPHQHEEEEVGAYYGGVDEV